MKTLQAHPRTEAKVERDAFLTKRRAGDVAPHRAPIVKIIAGWISSIKPPTRVCEGEEVGGRDGLARAWGPGGCGGHVP